MVRPPHPDNLELKDVSGQHPRYRLDRPFYKRVRSAERRLRDRFVIPPFSGRGLVTISKWPDATVAGTTGAHMRAVTHRGSSLPSCRTGPGPHGTWRAMPASVPQPTGAPDTACRQRRPASPRRCVGCAPYSRVRRQPHGLKDCHTLCPDTGVGVPPRWAVVVRPQWRPGSPPTAWHRARLLPQPQCSRGRPLHPQGDCAWYQPCHGP